MSEQGKGAPGREQRCTCAVRRQHAVAAQEATCLAGCQLSTQGRDRRREGNPSAPTFLGYSQGPSGGVGGVLCFDEVCGWVGG